MNRLASATSPYLLQHADNPVHWWEWGPDAFEEARERNVPVLLSVGYAACHWCHVMAHESFEDEATAAYLNEHFVSVKVDREERPDVDAVYMQATTAMTGNGGWPMTCVLDHDGVPFFAGTYFPDQPRHGQPAFGQILQALASGPRSPRRCSGSRAASASTCVDPWCPRATSRSGARCSTRRWRRSAPSSTRSAPGSAPRRVPSVDGAGVPAAVRRVSTGSTGGVRATGMLDRSLDAMARGGLYDQLGGGFARYSVDRGWVVPHFEKMLYDNAQLLGLYARRGGDLGARIARETADFLLRELGTEEGAFASALDADSPDPGGHSRGVPSTRGRRPSWPRCSGMTPAGPPTCCPSPTPARSRRVPRRSSSGRTPTTPSAGRPCGSGCSTRVPFGTAPPGTTRSWQPGTGWRSPDWSPRVATEAERCAAFVWEVHWVDGRLRRVSRDGAVGAHAGVLKDYGCLATAYIELAAATADPTWLGRARALLDVAVSHFAAGDGGYFDTADDAEALVSLPATRPQREPLGLVVTGARAPRVRRSHRLG